MDRCNGIVHQEMKVFDTAVPDLWKSDKTTQTFDMAVSDSMGSSSETAVISQWVCTANAWVVFLDNLLFYKL